MRKRSILILFLLTTLLTSIDAQNFNITNERTFSILFNHSIDTLENFHSSIRPFSKNELIDYDSLMTQLNIKSTSKFLKGLSNYGKLASSDESYIELLPIINTGLTYEKNSAFSNNLADLSFGLNMNTKIGKKWSSQLVFLSDYSKYPSYIDSIVQTKHISPSYGYSKNDHAFFGQGNITFTADKNFTIQLGYGKNFIGDGYRSLFLSDNANSYPYLKITANIWKLKYMALYTNFQDIQGSDGNFNNYFQKFATIHYLSYNLTKWWNIGLFESIVWQSQEGNFYRGYDINYLNPVLFLRPAEYAQGSSDNALLGGSMKFNIKKNTILYGQLLLDEFKLDELKARTGWWANKYGVQYGLKFYNLLGLQNLQLQLEYNMVRPFTYTHSYNPTSISTLQNYAHFNVPLAHPLGANFNEVMGALSYHKKRWIFEGISTFAKVGLDSTNTSNVGQNIYIPNNNRDQDYGFYTTQGLTTNIINSTVKISYVIHPKAQFIFQFGVTNRSYKNSVDNASTNLFFIGLKTAIINRYSDY